MRDVLFLGQKSIPATEEDLQVGRDLQNIEIEYYDWNWKKQRQKFTGWPAQICQHEMDHLEGILI